MTPPESDPISHFYVPLTGIKIDIQRMIGELHACLPISSISGDRGLTVTQDIAGQLYSFGRFNGISKYDDQGVRRVRTGERDEDITYWPKQLENTYIKEIGERLACLLELPGPRCRMSRFVGGLTGNLDMHCDPHTPVRVQIALITQPDIMWHLQAPDGSLVERHQPANGIPVLLRTGTLRHGVVVPKTAIRLHLWYQWYSWPRPDAITNLTEAYQDVRS